MSTATLSPEGRSLPPLALIAGPTASGKSDLAVRLALALRERGTAATIVNADSAQIYADLAVLSARPGEAEMHGVPHRLYGEWDGARICSAADWAQAARAVIADVHEQGGVPILVGGSGLYLRTLIEGIAKVPAIDPAVRDAVRALPPEQAYAALQAEDPPRAAVLHANDRARIARALEVVRSTGKPLALWQQVNVGGLQNAASMHPAVLLPALPTVRARGDERFVRMLESGAVEEVRALLARRLCPDLPVMRAIGVREIGGWLSGAWDRNEAVCRGQRATWQYVRRQYTWFRRQPPNDWRRYEADHYDLYDVFERLLRR